MPDPYRPFRSPKKPPVNCSACRDIGWLLTPTGYDYCICDQGRAEAIELGPAWLAKLNHSQRLTPVLSPAAPNPPVPNAITEADVQAALAKLHAKPRPN